MCGKEKKKGSSLAAIAIVLQVRLEEKSAHVNI